jgi:hypothetical protein
MGLFKSSEEKRFERDVEVRKAVNSLKRNIKEQDQHEKSYLEKARRAKRIGDNDQLTFLKSVLKKTAITKRLRERQLLSVETAMQIKNQAESDSEFAKAMMAVSKSINEVYGATDLAKTQREFEKALCQAETMSERMKIFVDMTTDQMAQVDGEAADEIISDKEIDKMIEEEAVHEEGKELDKEISQGLKELEDELKRKE